MHGVDSYKTNVIRDIAVRGLGEVIALTTQKLRFDLKISIRPT